MTEEIKEKVEETAVTTEEPTPSESVAQSTPLSPDEKEHIEKEEEKKILDINAAIAEQKKVISKKEMAKMEQARLNMLKTFREVLPDELLHKENPTPEDKEQIKMHVQKYLEREYLKRYNLDKVDLDKEYEKIKVKNSGLSRSQRDAVVGYFLIFKWGPIVQKKLDELQKKENRTEEEEQLLQSILGQTQLETAYQLVKEKEDATATTSETRVEEKR